ncbi:uncharacterized protein LOC113332136 isoform X1 [Papaver somniferum]|uniref:uncharacterized protein LOC113332136 isoform X1 n=1 Tax=Papaver somniferum TaxID=3469 RepID=UPI000E6FD8CB|nr:uncharacterized protein LOC113332136 isoform X1 [Papaver somniferum]XP_026434598.1 uncharacterized protein LOC113332136 isoform X1 [Papaver somniferum]XP_026434599.1 uncharacterized protein LOC113332136 isoform X1 [Papaver somniferum]
MGSDGDDVKDLTTENEIADDDLETQRLDSESSLELSDFNELEFQSTELFNGTSTAPVEIETQVWVDDETQVVVEDCDNDDENGTMTQLVVDDTEVQNYSDGDDGGLSDRTDILTEAGESGCESERGVGLGDDDAVYFNDSTSECRNSGQNVSTAIPLSNGTKEPDCGLVPSIDGTNANRASILNGSEPTSSAASDEDGEMAGIDDPSSFEEERIDVDRDYEGENMKLKDDIRNRDAVRKLFADETPYKNSGATNHCDSTHGERDYPQLDDGHKLADLSYLNSQEPGELSQANALDVVDKFLLINNVDCSQEDKVYLEKMVKEKSPIVPSAKGPRILAHRSNTKSPVGGVGTLDWDASREDEGGGEFFSKNKDVLFPSCGRGRGRGRKSFTQPRIPRSLKFGQGKSMDDKEQDLNLHQKIMGTVHSDSRLLLQKLRADDKNLPQIKARKNLFQEFDEQMNLESAEQQLEETNIVKDSRGMYDVGIDTQRAAEAMEALVCGFPNSHATADAIQVLPNSGDVMGITSYQDHASTRKRLSSSNVEGLFKQSKRTKTHDTKLSTEILTSSRMGSKTLGEDLRQDFTATPKQKRGRPISIEKPNTGISVPISSRLRSKGTKLEAFSGSSAIKPKQKRGRPKSGVSSSTGNAAALCETSSRRLSKVVAQGKAVGVVDKSNSNEVDKHTKSPLSGMSSSTTRQLLNKNPSPVARRTRQCRTIDALMKPENLPGGSGEKKHDDMPVANAVETEKVCSKMGTYTLEPSVCKGRCSESGRNLIDDVIKDKPTTLHEPLGLDFSHERSADTCSEVNRERKHGGREKNVSMSGHLKESGNLGSSSTVVDGVLEVNGPIRRSSRLRNDIRSSVVELDMNRKTQSSKSIHPSSSSVKNSKGNLVEQVVEPLCAYAVVNGSLSLNDKAILKDDGKATASKKFEKDVSMEGHLKESGNLGSSSTVVDGVLEVNGPIRRSSRLRNDIRSSVVELDMNRKTQSSKSIHPSSSSVKNSKGNLVEQVVEPLCAYAVVNGSLSLNDKAILKDDGKATASKKFEKDVSMEGHLKESGNLGSSSTVVDGALEVNGPIRRSSRLRNDIRSAAVELDMNRKTQSSISVHPSSSSVKNSKGNLVEQVVEPLCAYAAVNVSLSVNDKAILKGDGKATASKKFEKDVSMEGHLKESGNLGSSSTVVDRVLEVNGPITRSGRLRNHIRSTAIDLDLKRKTQASVSGHPSSSSVKNSKGNLIEQVVEPLCADTAVNGSLSVNDKALFKDDGKDAASKKFEKKGDASPVSTPKDVAGENTGLSTPKVIPHGLLCVTPDNCTTPANLSTPLNEASPICFGNGYQKLSCKRSLSKPSLARELNDLYMDAVHTPSSKDLRKRRDNGSIHVLFSRHLGNDIIKQQKKILARLGASVASSSLEATHFVADKFVRTRNMLEAIALGKPVVTPLWLKSCGQVSCFTDERNYILRDLKKEKEIGFSMPISLTRAGQSPLLKGRRVFVTASVKPSQELVASLVKAVHGQAVERLGRSAMKDDKVLDDLLVFSCEEDYEICVPLLEKGIAIYSSELLLNGIVMQKLEYERHRLFNDNIKRTRSSIWIRKDGEKFLPVTKSK